VVHQRVQFAVAELLKRGVRPWRCAHQAFGIVHGGVSAIAVEAAARERGGRR
jgi:hypothetical protein